MPETDSSPPESGDAQTREGRYPGRSPAFATTHWSAIASAGNEDSPKWREALAELCQTYWYPLYAYVRRQGHDEHEAKDLTQEFFSRLLAKNYFRALDRKRGKFRSWLLSAMEHFLAKEWRDARRLKRGGGQPLISLDDDTAENRYRLEPAESMTAERIYERRWAMTLLDRTLASLREEFVSNGKTALFENLQGALTGAADAPAYAELAGRLDMTEGAIKVAVHRLRQRYAQLLRAEISRTVADPAEVDGELRHLLTVLSA
ncbi:MAG: sigma-70 family RNA polymerase sigma factor [Verrucomicrobia bacterium]|nr:sigma-70 family RNA polymerase sigma factor [Verrucomicrobiota bacterium]